MSGISSKPPERSTRRWGESSDTETTLVPSFYVMKGEGKKKNHIYFVKLILNPIILTLISQVCLFQFNQSAAPVGEAVCQSLR